MGLNFIVGNRLETLAGELAERLRARPEGATPFDREVIVVMNPGNATWLTYELARRMGVCANIEFITRGGFWNRVIPGMDEAAKRFNPKVMSWRLLKMLADPAIDDEALRTYLRGEAGVSRPHFELANEIAKVFDVYQVYRADVLRDWFSKGCSSPEVEAAPHAQWQKKLWQRLHAATGGKAPAELFSEFLACELDAQAVEMTKTAFPTGRVFVFGIGTMPPLQVDLFRKLATLVDVHFFYLNPCRDFWGDATTERTALWRRRHGDDSATRVGNPMLASLAESGKTLFNTLLDTEAYGDAEERWDDPGTDTVLGEVQSAVLENRDADLAGREADGSLVLHICHSEMREMEVLRDDILRHLDKALASGEVLEPHDIVVMAPNISKYAPAIEAVFGSWNERHSGKAVLRYSITDRTHAEESQLANAYSALLSQWRGRMKFGEFRELLSCRAIWGGLGIEDERHRDHVLKHLYDSGIRWGWDAPHRDRISGVAFDENSWARGLRLLAGSYVMGTDIEGNPGGNAINDSIGRALGAVADLATRVHELGEELVKPHTPSSWCALLQRMIDDFIFVDEDSQTDVMTLRKAIDEFAATCAEACVDDMMLPCDIIDAYMTASLWSVADTGRFLTGGITFCRLQPLRNIPAQYVWIAGLNDNEYPRRDKFRSFDLLKTRPRTGDRSDRNDDCQLLLEAVLSARRNLRFSYVGNDAHDNGVIPPGVLLNEIRSELVQAFGETHAEVVSGKRVAGYELRHHLHHFSPDYFDADGRWQKEKVKQLWMNLSNEDFTAAVAVGQYSHGLLCTSACSGYLDSLDSGMIDKLERGCTADCDFLKRREFTIDELVGFWGSPAETWLKTVLKIFDQKESETFSDDEPVAFDKLDEFFVKDKVLRLFLEAGCPGDEWHRRPEIAASIIASLRRVGKMPVGVRGEQMVVNVIEEGAGFLDRVREQLEGWRPLGRDAGVSVSIGDFVLRGKIGGLYTDEKKARLVDLRPSNAHLKDWMRISIQTVLLPLSDVGLDLADSIFVRNKDILASSVVAAEAARARLEVYFTGMIDAMGGDPRPLLLIAKDTALACHLAKPGETEEETRKKIRSAVLGKWQGVYGSSSSDKDAWYNRILFGDALPRLVVEAMPDVCSQYMTDAVVVS